MSIRILIALTLSALLAIGLSVLVYRSGGGLLLAGVTYSLAGSCLLVVLAGAIALSEKVFVWFTLEPIPTVARRDRRFSERARPPPETAQEQAEASLAQEREPARV